MVVKQGFSTEQIIRKIAAPFAQWAYTGSSWFVRPCDISRPTFCVVTVGEGMWYPIHDPRRLRRGGMRNHDLTSCL